MKIKTTSSRFLILVLLFESVAGDVPDSFPCQVFRRHQAERRQFESVCRKPQSEYSRSFARSAKWRIHKVIKTWRLYNLRSNSSISADRNVFYACPKFVSASVFFLLGLRTYKKSLLVFWRGIEPYIKCKHTFSNSRGNRSSFHTFQRKNCWKTLSK